MKTRLIAILLPVLLTLGILCGCASASARQPDAPVIPTGAHSSDLPVTANEPATPQTAEIPPAQPAYLSKAEAIGIALKDAGLTEEQVVHRRAELDQEFGQPVYEVEFYSGDQEYDYDIHAETGQILFRESEPEREPAKPEQTPPAATAPPPSEPANSDRISKEKAIAIALQDAGLSESQVTRLKAEFDYDDGRPEYDVEFHYDGWEYDYEIHAESGKILKQDKDRDD